MQNPVWMVVLVALGACGADKAKSPPAVEPAKPVAVPAAKLAKPVLPTGTIEGSVLLLQGAELPSIGDPKKSSELALTDPAKPCTPIDAEDALPVKRDGETGGLASIHVAITGMKDIAAAAPVTHELRLVNCRLDRALLAARVGDSVRITNASGMPLLPSMAGDAFMEAILANGSRTVELKRQGADRLSCKFGAFCGRTEVLVTGHSLFAVTDRTGHFRIDGVPLDQEVTVHAWHPLFDESHEALTLKEPTRSAKVTLTLKPMLLVGAKGADAPPPPPPKPGEVLVH